MKNLEKIKYNANVGIVKWLTKGLTNCVLLCGLCMCCFWSTTPCFHLIIPNIKKKYTFEIQLHAYLTID
jgi:hypothetical protein